MRHLSLLLALTILFTLTGCINVSRTHTVLEPDAERVVVDFESEPGRDAFNKEVDRLYPRRRTVYQSHHRFRQISTSGLPIIHNTHHEDRLSPNAFFNRQVIYADRNNDLLLSDGEVENYTERPLR